MTRCAKRGATASEGFANGGSLYCCADDCAGAAGGLVIAGDTGPLHLAAALERPVVGMYGPTDPARNGPYGTRVAGAAACFERRDHTRQAETERGVVADHDGEVNCGRVRTC